MIQREVMTRPDGANWHIYHLERGFVALTSRGRELVHDDPDVLHALHAYRQAVVGAGIGGAALAEDTGVRNYFASGGNSDVYSVNSHLAIKEAINEQSAWSSLQRMDQLCSVIEERVPRWINIPVHYGLLTSANLQRQYLLMQKVDSGITVADINTRVTEPHTMSDVKRGHVEREFGTITPEEHTEIMERYTLAEVLLRSALKHDGLEPDDYMTDFHTGNVLIERSRTPVAGSDFALWVIDQ